jgi:hypothetical protein
MQRARSSRPDSVTAMRDLIAEIRRTLPFDKPEAQICTDPCRGCSIKLLDYMQAELENWEARLDAGEKPGLADLSSLARKGKKIVSTLQANRVI